MWRFLCVSLLCLGLGILGGTAYSRPLDQGYQHDVVTVQGKMRTFGVYFPKACQTDQALPLVIVLHGGLGCGWSAKWDSRMTEQAEKNHFIVAYPNGVFRTWNAGECCGPARELKIDDVAFIHALIEDMKSKHHVDSDRVFVTGISNGGMLAYRLAVELPDEIAAIAPVEGCMYQDKMDSSIPVSVIAVHGARDRIIRYDGGTGSMFGYKVTSKSVADTIRFWVNHDQCNEKPVHQQTGTIVKDLYANGKNGTEVCLYTLTKGGHAWPGGRRCIIAGDRPSKEFSATEAICEFFLSHPKRHD